MCPACMGSAALMVGTLVSTGGLTGFIVKVFHSKKNVKVLSTEECNSKEKYLGYGIQQGTERDSYAEDCFARPVAGRAKGTSGA